MKQLLILVRPDGDMPVEALMHTAQSDVEEEHLPEMKKLFKST